MSKYGLFQRFYRLNTKAGEPAGDSRPGEMFNDLRVKEYFDGLDLGAEDRDKLAERLCKLLPFVQWGPKKAAKEASNRETRRLNAILKKLEELDCLLSTGLTIKQYNSDKNWPMQTGHDIKKPLIKFHGFTSLQAAEADEKLRQWIAALPDIIQYISAEAEDAATDDWIGREVAQSLTAPMLYDELRYLYERFTGQTATTSNSQPTGYTNFAQMCCVLFGRAVDQTSISKQLPKRKR